MNYFRIVDSFTLHDRWCLATPRSANGEEIDPRLFTEGIKYGGDKIVEVPIAQGRRPIDFTFASFDMPVLKRDTAALIQTLAADGIQRVPVKNVGGYMGYEILNLLTLLKCINEKHSLISRWTESDGIPSKVGMYAGIARLALDRASIEGHEIFRIKDWELPLIVSETVKSSLERVGTSGIAFQELQVL